MPIGYTCRRGRVWPVLYKGCGPYDESDAITGRVWLELMANRVWSIP